VKKEKQFVPREDSWLLDALEAGDRRLAGRVLERTGVHFFPAGSHWPTLDLRPTDVCLVEQGLLVLRSPGFSGRHVVVAEAGAPSALLAPTMGEQLQALADSWITVLHRDELEGLLGIPSVATLLFDALGDALRTRQEATRYLASVRHVDRVRQKLLQLAREFGKVHPDGIHLDFVLTHDLLAEMVASARETVTRALDELQRIGFLVRENHSYTLLIPPDALDTFSGSERGAMPTGGG
jgi:CRP-like cAMP-binding protein